MVKPELSLVIPVYNERDSLGGLLRRCLRTCRDLAKPFEIILVDDGSSDGSDLMIMDAADGHAEIIGVLLNRNYGQHAAILAGLEHARGQIVITMDADLQNPPEEIPNLVREMEKGNDVVGTVRRNRQDTFFRRAASALTNRVVQWSTGVMMHDYGCMLRAYSRPIVKAMLRCRERSTFIPVLANSFARHCSEIEVGHNARIQGQSKYDIMKLLSLQFDLLTSMSTFPLRLLSLLGSVIAASGIGFGIFLMAARLLYGAEWAAQGVFTLFAVLFAFVGLQFVGLGLLGEYIGRIYQDVRARPRFFIREIRKGKCEAIEEPSDNTAKSVDLSFGKHDGLLLALAEKMFE